MFAKFFGKNQPRVIVGQCFDRVLYWNPNASQVHSETSVARRFIMRFATLKTAAPFLLSLCVILLVSVMASAYTIVMRGGKRIEIPAQFTVTRTTLSYEVASGINVTIQMAAIDVPATERANNEPPGALLKRANANAALQSARPAQDVPTTTKRRIVTNRDLETYARARRESEAAYERRRIELGLPSLEESRRRAQRDEAALDEIVARRRQEESENRRREREAELQAEMTAARINALNSVYVEPYWPDGFIGINDGAFGRFGSRFRFGFHPRFPSALNQGSPCGFNPSPSCLLSHPFPFGFNQQFFPSHRTILIAPGANRGGRRVFGGGQVLVSPRRR